MPSGGAVYLGGLSWAPESGWGDLLLDSEMIDLTTRNKKPIVRIYVAAIECIEITSEQAAKSKIGATLVFGIFGGLAAKGSEDRGTLLVHLKSGQTAYFEISGYSEHQLRAKLTPWLQAANIRVGTPEVEAAPAPAAVDPVSVADEIAKLGALKTQGLLTEEEFAAEKARLLGR
jgi:hypothetical protein